MIICPCARLQVPHPLYQATEEKLVPCADPLCDALHRDLGTTKSCRNGKTCQYKVEYLEGTSSYGLLLRDKFSLPTRTVPGVAFG